MNPAHVADNEASALSAARDLGFPVVLKTAADGIVHKTEQGGVCLSLCDEDELIAAYSDISSRLGTRVVVSPMVTGGGVEMMLGMTRDEQFGPLIVFGFGGVYAELLSDCASTLAPVDVETVARLLETLKMRPLLDGYRGAKPAAINEFCELVARFSQAVVALGDAVTEIDMNPIIVSSQSCIVVDALVVGNQSPHS